MAEPVEPYWEYIPGIESAEAYSAFEDYRDMDPKHRTYAAVTRRAGVPYSSVLRWSRENFWIDRVAHYDMYRAEQRQAELRRLETADVEAWSDQRAELLATLREVGLHALDQLAKDLKDRRTRLRPNETKQLLDVLLKYGNLANGDVTERVDNVLDLSQASDDDLAALERLRELGKSDDEDEHVH